MNLKSLSSAEKQTQRRDESDLQSFEDGLQASEVCQEEVQTIEEQETAVSHALFQYTYQETSQETEQEMQKWNLDQNWWAVNQI